MPVRWGLAACLRRCVVATSTERGSVMSQFAISLPVCIFLFTASLDALRVLYIQMVCEYAATETLRTASIGGTADRHVRGALFERQFVLIATTLSAGMVPSLGSVPAGQNNKYVTICSLTNSVTPCAYHEPPYPDDGGLSEDLIAIRVDIPIPVMFSAVSYPMHLIVLGKNEPFL